MAPSRTAPPTTVTAVVERPVTVSLVWSKALIYKFTTAGEEGNVEVPPVSSVKSVHLHEIGLIYNKFKYNWSSTIKNSTTYNRYCSS
jgi:hypothetical protein